MSEAIQIIQLDTFYDNSDKSATSHIILRKNEKALLNPELENPVVRQLPHI